MSVPQDPEIELTEREMAIARKAADMAVKKMTDEFYRQVGRGVVTKALIWIGAAVVGFAVARGWVRLP